MHIPTYDSLDAAITGCFGTGVSVARRDYVGGGDINDACCMNLSNGERVFLKSNTASNFAFFEAEAAGLEAVAATRTIGTPRLLALGLDRRKGTAFLMMEPVSGRKNADFWEDFGHSLAKMHLADTSGLVPGGRFGFFQDNFIGAGPQENTPAERWIDFFRLHLTGPDGRAWLIDPAAYVGHAEADLAMTELFGGFAPAFYAAYRQTNPLEPGYADRRDLYNLYHLLNHLNLFGPGYLPSVRRIIARYG